jgi:hypothetical protein
VPEDQGIEQREDLVDCGKDKRRDSQLPEVPQISIENLHGR